MGFTCQKYLAPGKNLLWCDLEPGHVSEWHYDREQGVRWMPDRPDEVAHESSRDPADSPVAVLIGLSGESGEHAAIKTAGGGTR